MIDANTIRFAAMAKTAADPLVAEFRALVSNQRQINWARKWCIRHGIDTRLDHPLGYKGRTYYTLASHPVVRRKKAQMRRIRTIFATRRAASIASGKIIPFEKNHSATKSFCLFPASKDFSASHPAHSAPSASSVVQISGAVNE